MIPCQDQGGWTPVHRLERRLLRHLPGWGSFGECPPNACPDTAVDETCRENGEGRRVVTGCSSEGGGLGIVVRARLHDRHLIDGEPLSSYCGDRGSCGLLGSRTAQSEVRPSEPCY